MKDVFSFVNPAIVYDEKGVVKSMARLKRELREVEYLLIKTAIKVSGNVSKACDLIDVSRVSIYRQYPEVGKLKND